MSNPEAWLPEMACDASHACGYPRPHATTAVFTCANRFTASYRCGHHHESASGLITHHSIQGIRVRSGLIQSQLVKAKLRPRLRLDITLQSDLDHEKSSPFSSMPSFTLKRRVVFHLSSLVNWSNWNSLSANFSWSPSSAASDRSTRSWCSLVWEKLGSSSRYDSSARLVATMSADARWQIPALSRYSFTDHFIKLLLMLDCEMRS
jgi:hypothetical protein